MCGATGTTCKLPPFTVAHRSSLYESTPPSKRIKVWRAEALRAITLEHPDAERDPQETAELMLPLIERLAARDGFSGPGMPSLAFTAMYVRRNYDKV